MNMMRTYASAVLAACVLPFAAQAVDLSELMNPDDVMLRKPSAKAAAPQKPAQAAAEAAARAELDRKAAERALAAKAEAERRAAAEKKAAETVRARAEAEKKAAAEALAKAEAEKRRLREQVASEQAARAKAEKAKSAAEEAKSAAEEAKSAAEAKADAEKRAAAKAVEQAEKAKAIAEKRAAYLANPDPDERPAPKKRLVAADGAADVTEGTPGAAAKAAKRPAKKPLTGRAAVITADRTDYDRKEGVILFDRNVYVDDEQYQMHAERMFVFLDGTNDLKRLVALGGVSITNEEKSASCQKAVYMKSASKIVMYGDEKNPAWLRDAGGKAGDASEVRGLRITYWLDTGLATVERSVITVPGLKGSNSPKDLFGAGLRKSKDR